jgi:hypothetical protein
MNTERCRDRFTLNGHVITVTELVPGDGSRHVFHVVLHDHDVRLTEGLPLNHLPSTGEIIALLDTYRDAYHDRLGALVAATRHACTELHMVVTDGATVIPKPYTEWLQRIREHLAIELVA